MKKFLFILAISMPLISFIGCSDEEKEERQLQEVFFDGFKALSPTSDYEQVTTIFYLFSLETGNEFKLNSYEFDGNVVEYQEIEDETWDLLQEGKLKNTKGDIIKADYKIYSFPEETGPEHVLSGSYLMVAIYEGSKEGYLWIYSNKYACQNVVIEPKEVSFNYYSVVFPCDLHHYGKIRWVSSGEKPYPYDFSFN